MSQFEKSQQVYISGKEGDSISRSTMSTSHPFTAKEIEDLKQVAHVNYTLNEFKELSHILGHSVMLWDVLKIW